MIFSESPPSFDEEATPTDSEELSWQLVQKDLVLLRLNLKFQQDARLKGKINIGLVPNTIWTDSYTSLLYDIILIIISHNPIPFPHYSLVPIRSIDMHVHKFHFSLLQSDSHTNHIIN